MSKSVTTGSSIIKLAVLLIEVLAKRTKIVKSSFPVNGSAVSLLSNMWLVHLRAAPAPFQRWKNVKKSTAYQDFAEH